MGWLCLRVGLSVVFALVASATTLEQLSLDELIRQSTTVVRGVPVSSRVESAGAMIYTVYSVRVTDHWKGDIGAEVEVSLPGGSTAGVSQVFSGVPQLESGREYVILLWTGPSGRTQIIGLTQGLFDIRGSSGDIRLVQTASPDVMIVPGTDVARQLDLSLPAFVQSLRAKR